VQIDTLLLAPWIIPVEPDARVLRDHALAVDSGKIVELLPAEDAERKYRALEVERLDGHALIPGLINSHCHAAMSLFRGLADDLPLMDWLNEHIWPAEQRWLSPAFVADGTQLAAAELIRCGVTTFCDMYFFPRQAAETAADAGLRVAVGLVMLEFPTPWARDADEYLAKGLDVHDRFRGHPRVRTVLAPHAPYTVSDTSLRRIATLAEEIDVPIQMHLHESPVEIAQSLEQHGKRPLHRLLDLGLLSPRLMAVHMTQIEPDEVQLAARHGLHVIHCPQSNLKLASGFCPVQPLLEAGVNVALGTDGAASNNDLDMLSEMQTAALLAKGVSGSSSAVPAAVALRMATLNGARALGIDEITGSLLPGKDADLCAIRLDEIETQPLYDPLSQIVYAAGRSQVTHVWAAGKPLLRNRELLTLDADLLRANARHWAERITAARSS
jgi:5-methylthioadenosine/S-adenosylhomocysteine deaminase